MERRGFGLLSRIEPLVTQPPNDAMPLKMNSGTPVVHFPISFDGWYRVLSSLVGLLPSSSYVNVDSEQVQVRMGWAFSSRFPRSVVVSVSEPGRRPISRGVHGFAGRWLVNGSGTGVVSIQLSPRQRAYVLGFPVRLRLLMVSVAEPGALAAAIGQGLKGA
jgi:hypothetical protein